MSWNIDLPRAEYIDPYSPNLQNVIQEVCAQKVVAIDSETTGLVTWKDIPLYWSLAWGNRRVTLHSSVLPYFQPAFQDSNKDWVFANAKYDAHMFANVGVNLAGRLVDTCVMHALLYEERPHGLKPMAMHLLGWKWSDFQDTFGKIKKDHSAEHVIRRAEQENFPLLVEYASNDSWGTLKCYETLKKQLEQAYTHSLFSAVPPYINTLWDLFDKIEVPYTKILWKNERNGILIDKQRLEEIGPKLVQDIGNLERRITQLVGESGYPGLFKPTDAGFRDYFFEFLKINPPKMTKGGKSGVRQPSVDASVLERLADDGNMVAKLKLELSELQKLHSTYVEGLYSRLDPYGRIHTRFNQDVARTGRLSCVASWTPLKTARGFIPISEVVPGDRVWTHRGRWRRVLDSFTKGPGDMYDVHFCNGEVLTCTTDHKLLNTDGQWVSLGEIIDVHFEAVGWAKETSGGSTPPLPINRATHGRDHRQETEHDAPQRHARPEDAHARSGEKSSSQTPVLSVEDRRQESHEGKDGEATPQLDRGVRGRVRVSDLPARGQESLRAPRGDAESLGAEENPKGHGSSPHRWEPKKQQLGQPGTGHQEGAPGYPLFTEEGLPGCSIKEVVYRGRLEVHDVTVEEDASYLACGVFSHNSSDPNLQNIPNPENDKWGMRGIFVAPPGYSLIVSDYSQLEMRLLACASLDEGLIDVFRKGWDVHMGNASLIFDIPYDEIVEAKKVDKKVKNGELPEHALTQRMKECLHHRLSAKTLGFGLVYGMGTKKLANALGIPIPAAEGLTKRFKERMPAVDSFAKEAIAETERYGYAFTILGRRRNVPEIRSTRRDERMRAERISLNTQIQGSAADVVKMAQLLCDKACLEQRYGCRPLLQIHDELIFECPNETVKEAKAEIKDWMEHPFFEDLAVPLDVEAGSGDSWLKAK